MFYLSQLAEPQFVISVSVALFVVVGGLLTLAVKVWPVVRKTNAVLNDLSGEPARPGVPERPGVMVRLQRVEDHAQSASFNSKPNHGSSAHDTLINKLDDIETRLCETTETLEYSKADRQEIWYRLQKLQDREP